MSSTLDKEEFSGTTRTFGINWTYCRWRTQLTKWTKQSFSSMMINMKSIREKEKINHPVKYEQMEVPEQSIYKEQS